MNNLSKCIITSASNKFVPSLLNMLGSFEKNYPDHPHIYIYDLGISSFIKKDILKFKEVSIINVPHFVPFWRSCYTWKTYILNTPLADLNFYIDAGCQILRPLSEVFEKIEKNGYYLVGQGKEVFAKDITPKEYIELFEIPADKLNHEVVAAGIVGFKKNDEQIKKVTSVLYDAGVTGLSLGFSKKDLWKNKGKNKNEFLRDCLLFRHDTTLLTLFVIKYLKGATIESLDLFQGHITGDPNQLVWNLRMNYSKLDYLNTSNLSLLSRIFIYTFINAKKVKTWIRLKK